MTKVIKAKILNAGMNFISGKNVTKGTLNMLIDEYPSFVYHQIGNYFYAETKDGFVSVYEYIPGSTDGFGGAEITLEMADGSSKSFKGSLWSPFSVKNPNVPDYKPAGITNDPDAYDRGYTFRSCDLTPGLYAEIISSINP